MSSRLSRPLSALTIVVVNANHFRFLSQAKIQFGDILLETLENSLFSDKMVTFFSFRIPSITPGVFTITISPVPCTRPCMHSVTFLFLQRDTTALKVISQMPTTGPFQHSSCCDAMGMDVVIENLPPTLLPLDITVEFGNILWIVSDMTFLESAVGVLTVTVPKYTVASVVDVVITMEKDTEAQKIVFQYAFFDGNKPRTVSLAPTRVPVSSGWLSVSSGLLLLHPEVALVVANLPEGLNSSSVTVFCDHIQLQVIDLRNMGSCAKGQIDCLCVKILLRLPAFTSVGSRNITISVQGEEFMAGTVEFSQGCDYTQICGDSKVVDMLRMVAIPVISCDKTLCLHPNTLPQPEILHVSSSQGLSLGGETVHVHVRNFLILTASKVRVEVLAFSDLVALANVSEYYLSPGSSFASSEGRITIITPHVPPTTETVLVTISVQYGTLRKAATRATATANFAFEYMPLLQGSAVVKSVMPHTLRKTQDVLLWVELSNFQRLTLPFNTS